MSTDIDNAFVEQFNAEVFVAYQRRGSKLRGMVYEKPSNGAATVHFPKYGTGEVGEKDRHGHIPIFNGEHTRPSVTLRDYYGGDYVDKLDEIKTNIDERGLIVNAVAMACGRKVDSRIIAAAETGVAGAQTIVHGSAGLTKAKCLTLFQMFADAEIPDDGERVVVVGSKQWTELMDLAEFKSQDYVGPDSLPWATGVTAKRWLGMLWILHTGLGITSTTRRCLAWHRPAMGLGMGMEVSTNFDWVPERAAYLAQGQISMEALRIADEGVFLIECNE